MTPHTDIDKDSRTSTHSRNEHVCRRATAAIAHPSMPRVPHTPQYASVARLCGDYAARVGWWEAAAHYFLRAMGADPQDYTSAHNHGVCMLNLLRNMTTTIEEASQHKPERQQRHHCNEYRIYALSAASSVADALRRAQSVGAPVPAVGRWYGELGTALVLAGCTDESSRDLMRDIHDCGRKMGNNTVAEIDAAALEFAVVYANAQSQGRAGSVAAPRSSDEQPQRKGKERLLHSLGEAAVWFLDQSMVEDTTIETHMWVAFRIEAASPARAMAHLERCLGRERRGGATATATVRWDGDAMQWDGDIQAQANGVQVSSIVYRLGRLYRTQGMVIEEEELYSSALAWGVWQHRDQRPGYIYRGKPLSAMPWWTGTCGFRGHMTWFVLSNAWNCVYWCVCLLGAGERAG